MIEVTFTGETLEDAATQAANFASVVLGGTKPEKTSKAAPAQTNTTTDESTATTPPSEDAKPAPDTKALEKTREIALDKLRTMYSSGKEGQAAVKAISKTFKVKKLGDVPVEEAAALLVAVEEAETKLTEAAPV